MQKQHILSNGLSTMPHGISSPWELMISDLESDTDCVTQIKACIINKLYLLLLCFHSKVQNNPENLTSKIKDSLRVVLNLITLNILEND